MAGWLFQVTPVSVQLPASARACNVRPVFADAEYRRSVADSSMQPPGAGGSEKRTSARKLSVGPFDCTFRIESVPLLLELLFWSIQASAFAETGGRATHESATKGRTEATGATTAKVSTKTVSGAISKRFIDLAFDIGILLSHAQPSTATGTSRDQDRRRAAWADRLGQAFILSAPDIEVKPTRGCP
jgi:hypothetical protein